MHGIILVELKKYVDAEFGDDAWRALLGEAGLGGKVYLATQQYFDKEVIALLTAASSQTGSSTESILRSFGQFLIPDLVSVYAAYIRPQWGALDLLEQVETTMHRAVRMQNPGATPPRLRCERVSPSEVIITYTSARQLCALGEGLIAGVADHYHTSLSVNQQMCMLRGDSSCRLSVTLAT
ncbi:MAG: heme NO-binding domain-containing protein [Chloroflexi bacterium]|nr:heme NO-binding domain-containing protein [Chloroflexota bacterium]